MSASIDLRNHVETCLILASRIANPEVSGWQTGRAVLIDNDRIEAVVPRAQAVALAGGSHRVMLGQPVSVLQAGRPVRLDSQEQI